MSVDSSNGRSRPTTRGWTLGLGPVSATWLGLLALPTLLGFVGGWWWPFDLLAHFRVQYLVIALVMVAVFAWRRSRAATLGAAVLALMNAAPVASSWLGAAAEGAPALRLLSANVNSANTGYAALSEEIARSKPDVVVVLEVSAGWASALEGLTDYPVREVVARGDNFGIAVLSRGPMDAEVVHLGGPDGVPSIVARLDRGRPLTLVATHPVPPTGAGGTAERDAQLVAVAEVARASGPNVVVVGDLNTTPWAASYGILTDAGLEDTRTGHGLQATWPAGFLPLAIPIDHCLVTPSLGAARREVLDDVGSDHYPILVDLVWR